jgi:hypothetical protein
MPLQDVSNDPTMMDWLRQAGHGHLLDERIHNTNAASSSSPPPPPSLNAPFGQTTSSSNYPPQSTSLPPPPPQPSFGGGYNTSGAQSNAFNRAAAAFPLTDLHPTPTYGPNSSSSPPVIPPTSHFNASPYNQQSSPLHFSSSPTQFLAPNINQQQLDADIEVK